MIHTISPDTLKVIADMDKSIGQFMQRRAEMVNNLVIDTATFFVGDIVLVYKDGINLGQGSLIQPLFLKKLGVVGYRIKLDNGEEITTSDSTHLVLLPKAEMFSGNLNDPLVNNSDLSRAQKSS